MKVMTKRLILVQLGMQYLYSTHAYSGDTENAKFMVYLPNIDISETKSFIEDAELQWISSDPDFYEFAILLGEEHIGGVCVYLDEDRKIGELGWIIHKDYWGNGYAVEAANGIIDFGIKKLKINKFVAFCDSENIASYRVMEKLGMALESRRRGRKNKLSEEDREELKYSLEIDT